MRSNSPIHDTIVCKQTNVGLTPRSSATVYVVQKSRPISETPWPFPVNTMTSSRRQYDVLRQYDVIPRSCRRRLLIGPPSGRRRAAAARRRHDVGCRRMTSATDGCRRMTSATDVMPTSRGRTDDDVFRRFDSLNSLHSSSHHCCICRLPGVVPNVG